MVGAIRVCVVHILKTGRASRESASNRLPVPRTPEPRTPQASDRLRGFVERAWSPKHGVLQTAAVVGPLSPVLATRRNPNSTRYRMTVRHSIEWRSCCLGSITNLKIRIAGRDRPAGLRGVGDRTERGAARAGTPSPSIQRMGDPLFRFDIHKQPQYTGMPYTLKESLA